MHPAPATPTCLRHASLHIKKIWTCRCPRVYEVSFEGSAEVQTVEERTCGRERGSIESGGWRDRRPYEPTATARTTKRRDAGPTNENG